MAFLEELRVVASERATSVIAFGDVESHIRLLGLRFAGLRKEHLFVLSDAFDRSTQERYYSTSHDGGWTGDAVAQFDWVVERSRRREKTGLRPFLDVRGNGGITYRPSQNPWGFARADDTLLLIDVRSPITTLVARRRIPEYFGARRAHDQWPDELLTLIYWGQVVYPSISAKAPDMTMLGILTTYSLFYQDAGWSFFDQFLDQSGMGGKLEPSSKRAAATWILREMGDREEPAIVALPDPEDGVTMDWSY